jgi:hypothetical protein
MKHSCHLPLPQALPLDKAVRETGSHKAQRGLHSDNIHWICRACLHACVLQHIQEEGHESRFNRVDVKSQL